MDLRAQRENFDILGWLQWGKRVKMSFLRRAKRARKKMGGILPRRGTNNKNHLIVKDPRGTNNKTHLVKNSSNLGFFELKGGVFIINRTVLYENCLERPCSHG